jgi:hypothetical protein
MLARMRRATRAARAVPRPSGPIRRTAPYTYDPNETDEQFDSLSDAQKDHYISTQPGESNFGESDEPDPR